MIHGEDEHEHGHGHPADDIALLVVRTRRIAPERCADWHVPHYPSEVSRVRDAVTEQIVAWGLPEQAYAAQLIDSELVTNAIRYGTRPIALRLIRNQSLICEVSDGTATSPRMRRAHTTDEGDRGLFLVAQLAARWGTRYTHDGKIIWAEQPLPQPPPPVRSSPAAAR
jgi:anti-sigma regulatory factor (Ser/Thr protein kinase)